MKKYLFHHSLNACGFCILSALILLTSTTSFDAHAIGSVDLGVFQAVENNREPSACQGLSAGSWVTAVITSKVSPPTPTGQAIKFGADTSAYLFNILLKMCPPLIVVPDTVKKHPKSAGACTATFNQPVTQGEYENWNGVPKSYLFAEAKDRLGISTWGELGRPLVYHFNTSADVRLIDPSKPEGAENDAWEADTNGDLTLPVGRNVVTWRADSMMALTDLTPLFLIPLVAPGDKIAKKLISKNRRLSEGVYKTYGRLTKYGDGGKVRTVVSKFIVKKISDVIEGLPETIVEQILDRGVGLDWRASQITGVPYAFNSMGQEVWVYDTVPPTLETNKDSATFPPSLQPLLSYDINTDTYYLEAFSPRIADFTVETFGKRLLTAEDECQGNRPSLNPMRIGPALRSFWISGDQGTIRWQVADGGPNTVGGVNLSNEVEQNFVVRDTNPPILNAPPSKVIEIPAVSNSTTVKLGSPQVFDLADLTPSISNDAPVNSIFNVGINTVTWTAADFSGNTVNDEQLINIKLEGTNTAPTAFDQVVSAASFKPVDITLEGFDSDFDPSGGRHDPLSFIIKDKPDNGFFIAPLLPYFIDDYRLEASALRFANEPAQVDPGQYCKDKQDGTITGPDNFQIKYPYLSEWFSVDDDSVTVVYDQGDMACQFGDLESRYRIAMFDANGDLLRNRSMGSTINNIYIDWRTKGIYLVDAPDSGQPNNIIYYDKELHFLGNFNAEYIDNSGFSQRITGNASIAADSQGIVYVVGTNTGTNDVVAFQGPASAADLGVDKSYKYLGTLYGSDGNFRDIATDSENNVFISKPDRILKFAASSVDGQGKLIPGAFMGWMGRCESNLTNTFACDTVNQRSISFSCTDTLCGTSGNNYGNEPAQFNDARGIAIDPKDILYVSDFGNSRVQRFTPDGDFAGEAKSTGAGYGFILGDFGKPRDITVNSDHFYILNNNLLHVLQTTPVTPIDDTSAKVTYQSENNFVGTDSFTFEATDGLDSGTGLVTINVERDFRSPVISVPPTAIVDEDGTVDITLVGSDPDGSLDTLSYTIVEPPQNGSLGGFGESIVYIPDADFYGEDSFSYKVSDGVFESEPAVVNLMITPVEDAPEVTTEAAVDERLGFNFQFPVNVYDPDEDEALMVSIDWGDGSLVDFDGVIMQGGVVVSGDFIQADGTLPDDYEATGPMLNLDEDGTGSVIFEHAYTAVGNHTAQICVSDRVETLVDGSKQPTPDSQTTCTQTKFSVALIADLILVVEPEADEVDSGTSQKYTVALTNRPFDVDVTSVPRGLDATNITVSGDHGDGLSLTKISSAQGVCTIDLDTFECVIGNLAFGDSTTIVVDVSIDPLVPGGAMLTLVANRTADTIPVLEEESVGVMLVNLSGRPPVAKLLSETVGSASGSQVLMITGIDFDEYVEVLFDNLPATDIEVINSTTIKLLTPAHSEGTVDIVVVNSDEQSTTLTAAYKFEEITAVNNTGSSSGSGGGGSFDAISIIIMLLLMKLQPIVRRRWIV